MTFWFPPCGSCKKHTFCSRTIKSSNNTFNMVFPIYQRRMVKLGCFGVNIKPIVLMELLNKTFTLTLRNTLRSPTSLKTFHKTNIPEFEDILKVNISDWK